MRFLMQIPALCCVSVGECEIFTVRFGDIVGLSWARWICSSDCTVIKFVKLLGDDLLLWLLDR